MTPLPIYIYKRGQSTAVVINESILRLSQQYTHSSLLSKQCHSWPHRVVPVSSKSTYRSLFSKKERGLKKARTDPSTRPRMTVAAASNALRLFELLEISSAINIYIYTSRLTYSVQWEVEQACFDINKHVCGNRQNQILGYIARIILNHCPSNVFDSYERISCEEREGIKGCWTDAELVQGSKAKYVKKIFPAAMGLGWFALLSRGTNGFNQEMKIGDGSPGVVFI